MQAFYMYTPTHDTYTGTNSITKHTHTHPTIEIDYITLLTFNGELRSRREFQHVREDHLSPVAAVGDQTQVRQRPLGRSNLVLTLRQQVAWEQGNGSMRSVTHKCHV